MVEEFLNSIYRAGRSVDSPGLRILIACPTAGGLLILKTTILSWLCTYVSPSRCEMSRRKCLLKVAVQRALLLRYTVDPFIISSRICQKYKCMFLPRKDPVESGPRLSVFQGHLFQGSVGLTKLPSYLFHSKA